MNMIINAFVENYTSIFVIQIATFFMLLILNNVLILKKNNNKTKNLQITEFLQILDRALYSDRKFQNRMCGLNFHLLMNYINCSAWQKVIWRIVGRLYNMVWITRSYKKISPRAPYTTVNYARYVNFNGIPYW